DESILENDVHTDELLAVEQRLARDETIRQRVEGRLVLDDLLINFLQDRSGFVLKFRLARGAAEADFAAFDLHDDRIAHRAERLARNGACRERIGIALDIVIT